MRGASKQRVGYKNTNVLRKSLRKRPRLGSRQTGVRVKSGLEGWAQVGGKLMQMRSQTSLAARSPTRLAARSADRAGRRGAGLGSRAGGGGPGAAGRGALYVLVGVRDGAAARGSKVHERGGGLRAGLRRRRGRRRRGGAEADSSGVPGGGGDSGPEAARPRSPRPRAPGPGRGSPAAASPARAPGRCCEAGPGARRPSRRVYTPDGGFSPIPFSTSSIRSSSITTLLARPIWPSLGGRLA